MLFGCIKKKRDGSVGSLQLTLVLSVVTQDLYFEKIIARAEMGITIYIPECFVVNTRELPVSACSRPQGVGVFFSLLPTSLFEHVSMGQARNPPTHWTTLRA